MKPEERRSEWKFLVKPKNILRPKGIIIKVHKSTLTWADMIGGKERKGGG